MKRKTILLLTTFCLLANNVLFLYALSYSGSTEKESAVCNNEKPGSCCNSKEEANTDDTETCCGMKGCCADLPAQSIAYSIIVGDLLKDKTTIPPLTSLELAKKHSRYHGYLSDGFLKTLIKPPAA